MPTPAPRSAPSSRSSSRTASTGACSSCATRRGSPRRSAVIPPVLVPIVARFTGRLTCEEIAREASEELGGRAPGRGRRAPRGGARARPLPRGRRPSAKRARASSASSPRRRCAPADARRGRVPRRGRQAASATSTESCLAKANGAGGARGRTAGAMVGLVAPAHRSVARRRRLRPRVRRARRGAPARGRHVRPLRHVARADARAVRALPQGLRDAARRRWTPTSRHRRARRVAPTGFDPYADQFNHKREHSLEFQVVFLKHLLGDRPARIVPMLAGLGAQQASGEDPARDARVTRFVDGRARARRVAPGPRRRRRRRRPRARRARASATSEPYDAATARRARARGPRVARARHRARRGRLLGARRARPRRAPRLRARADLVAPAEHRRAARAAGCSTTSRRSTRDDGSIVSHAAVGFYDPF